MSNLVITSDQLPDFMRGSEDRGTELLKEFVVPPRMKVVQKQSSSAWLDQFNVGDVVAVPLRQLVAPMQLHEKTKKPTNEGTPFHFVPVFFYPEWLTWNPLETKGTLKSIRARSLEKTSDIARAARNEDTRQFPCPEMAEKDGKKLYCRHVETLNFIVLLINGHAMEGFPIAMSFARAEHASGRNLSTMIAMRRAPVWGCQFKGQVGFRQNSQGEWFGIDVSNPTDVTPFVMDKNLFDTYEALHEHFKKAHEERRLEVNFEDDDEDVTAPADSKGEF